MKEATRKKQLERSFLLLYFNLSPVILGVVKPETENQSYKHQQDAYHLNYVVTRIHPDFLEESVAGCNLHSRPQYDDVGKRHAQVSTPMTDVQLLLEDHTRTDETEDTDGISHRMSGAEEHRVVAEH